MKKQIVVSALMAGMVCTPIFAEEMTGENNAEVQKQMDPADLTKVYREITPTINSNMDVRLFTKLTGAWNENVNFAAILEGTMGTGTDEKKFGTSLLNARAQYFQVHQTGFSSLPGAGFSFDYIRSRQETLPDDQLFALGAMLKLSRDYTGNFMIFPNFGYANGRMLDRDVDGVLATIQITRYIGNNGGYIHFWPEFINVTGENIRSQSKNLHFIGTVPFSSDKKYWFYTKAIYENNTVKLNGAKLDTPATTSFNVGVRMYF